MTATLFTEAWEVSANGGPPMPVTLPHDAMLDEERHPDAPAGAGGAFFAGGRYIYTREWTYDAVPGRKPELLFEGVLGTTVVRLNGIEVGRNISGYREFTVPLTGAVPGSVNTIDVEVDNSRQPSSRWYSGSGIYRKVWLELVPTPHIVRGGVQFSTSTVQGEALVHAKIEIDSPTRGTHVRVRLFEDGTPITQAVAEVSGAHADFQLQVPSARLWSAESPYLYEAHVDLLVDAEISDTQVHRIGLRTIEVDAQRGLRINGQQVLLRGGCVHHDSGALGAATFRSAEFRRARILKESGFNAIRSAHTPMSRDLLDACDELGLYVIDEVTDVWYAPKTEHDLAPQFEEIWPGDVESMVRKDRIHPSVIMYSIGNENVETSTPQGVETARRMRDYVRTLDAERPITAAVNFLLNLMAGKGEPPTAAPAASKTPEKKPSAVTSTAANIMADKLGNIMQIVARAPGADKATRDVLAELDVASYNYAWGRYKGDARRHPDRVVLGSESLPGDIAKLWKHVEALPNVIGDFTWSAWDYLGETGIGTWGYGEAASTSRLSKPYPSLLSGSGVIDITGRPGVASYLHRATWGLLPHPEIAVRPLDKSGLKVRHFAWRSTDAIDSWSWSGAEGRTAELEIYSTNDQVEVLINGRSLGRKRAGRSVGFITRYSTIYQPGEIVAIGYANGVEVSRTVKISAKEAQVRLVAEASDFKADEQDLAFVWVELADEDGNVEMLDDDLVTIEVTGAGVLAALGSAASSTTEDLRSSTRSTHYGRALAVVRSSGEPGEVGIRVRSERHGEHAITVVAASVTAPLSPRG